MKLGFKDVEAVFSSRYAIVPSDSGMAAFRGRLQHLQRGGFPEGVNTGKGRKAEYGWDQIVQLSLALDLIDVGVSPDRVASLVKAHRDEILVHTTALVHFFDDSSLLGAVREEKCPYDHNIFISISANALRALARNGELGGQSVDIITGENLVSRIKDPNPFDAYGTIIDHGTRLFLTINLISALTSTKLAELVNDFRAWAERWQESRVTNGVDP